MSDEAPPSSGITEDRREGFRQEVVRTFERYARFYNLVELVVPFMRPNPRALVADSIAPDSRAILDACTGNGSVLAAIADRHPKASVFGLDLSPDMLRLARRRIRRRGLANARIELGDCTKMPFEDATFDAVTGSYGLHEMPDDVRRAAVAEALRVLKPGGRLVVIDWDEPHRAIERPVAAIRGSVEPDWIDELYGDGLPSLLSAAGFAEIATRRDVFLSQLVVAMKPRQ